MIINSRATNWLLKFQKVLFFVFLITLFKGLAINNITYILVILISVFTFNKDCRSIKIYSHKTMLFLLPIIYFIFDLAVFGNFQQNIGLISRYCILLTAPLLFVNQNIKAFRNIYFLVYFIYFLGILYAVFSAYVKVNAFNFSMFGDKIEAYTFIERLYFGYMSVLASILIIEKFKTQKIKIYVILTLILLVVFLSASRFSFLIILALLMREIFVDFKRQITLSKVGVLFFLLVIFSVFALKNDGIRKRLYIDSMSIENFITNVKIREPRYAITKSAITLLNNKEYNWITGFDNVNDLKNKLINAYKKEVFIKGKREWFVKQKYNTHNQYLNVLLLHGILGLVFLIVALIQLYKYGNFELTKTISLLIILLFLIENPFNRQIGVYLITISLALIIDKKASTEIKMVANK